MSNMSEKQKLPQEENPNYFMRRAAAAGLTLAVGAGGYGVGKGVEAIVENSEMKPLISTEAVLLPGQGVIQLVESEVPSLATQVNIDPSSIPQGLIVSESQSAAKEMKELSGETSNQPGERYIIQLQKNGFGATSIDVMPGGEYAPSEPQNSGDITDVELPTTLPAPDTK